MDVRMPTPVLRQGKSRSFWLRKRVPDRYRKIVGRSEIWRSLKTADRKRAAAACATMSVELEAEWEQRWLARQTGLPDPVTRKLPYSTLTHKQIAALAGECYRDYVGRHGDNPNRALLDKEESRRSFPPSALSGDELLLYVPEIRNFLRGRKLRLSPDSRCSFARAFFKARGLAITSVRRRADGDFREPPEASHFPPPEPPRPWRRVGVREVRREVAENTRCCRGADPRI
jgi:hypothetical protein